MTGIFDAHNDLLAEVTYRRAEPRPFGRYWLDQLVKGGVKVQVCPMFSAHLPPGERLRWTLFQAAAFHRAVADHPDVLTWVRTREDLAEVLAGDRIGMVLAMEGVEAFEEDEAAVDLLWDLGVRMAGLTWNASNRFATGGGSDDTDTGLTPAGRELVWRMQDLGYVLDLAHTSPKTYDDIVELSTTRPPVLSHGGCRAVFDTPRNYDDDQLRALAEVGGVIGIMLLPLTVDLDGPTLDRVADHAGHVAAIAGDDHVGIGSDFIAQVVRSGAMGPAPKISEWLPANQRAATMAPDASVEDLAGPADFGNLVEALQRRGWHGNRLDGLLLGNFARLMHDALPARGGMA
ncbi:dipeptidase [Amycolatopsis jejuensis]|uniref:dipeptidase n=1 Tax=Amycolatopsis jejuensis TaxID=330084 RepID=UPI00068DC7FC|nr:membrane dipeptidase [Amycolatopsis jejuensis]